MANAQDVMQVLNGAILGLGLFFLGLQLTGQNMRALSGGGFRALARKATARPAGAALCGVVAGALMQSATAVTFIVVSMVGAGIVASPSARIVVVWSNVGLTALAFLAALNIHPYVALLVGFAGIAMGSIRAKPWNTIAGALLGVGIILFGLEQLGSGLAPLREAAWFRDGIGFAMESPWLGFGIGIAAAAILQSNTGATMVLITLVESGGLSMEQAIPAIYGTNLGAILLRAFLSKGLKGSPLRLVRMEDLFCVFGGAVMMGLLLLERAGVPLVEALAKHAVSEDTMRLALVFLLSNAIPAILISPLLPACAGLLKRIWPTDPADEPGKPKFLTSQALGDPETALDLIARELGRLFGMIDVSPRRSSSGTEGEAVESPAQIQLAGAIEQFCVRLASEANLSRTQARRLQLLRAWLHTLRHLGEAASELSASLGALPEDELPPAEALLKWVRETIHAGAEATASLDPGKIDSFFEKSKIKSPDVRAMRAGYESTCSRCGGDAVLRMGRVLDSLDILAWLLHRLSKLQVKATQMPLVPPEPQAGS